MKPNHTLKTHMNTGNPHGVFAAALHLTGLVVSAEPDQSADKRWKPVEQPQLAAAVEAAPDIKFEELAKGPATT